MDGPVAALPPAGSVVLGIQSAQIPGNTVRGIARYTREHLLALVQTAPETVHSVVVDPSLAMPAEVETLPVSIPLRAVDRTPHERPRRMAFHVMSPMEGLPIERLWPAWARRRDVALVVTVFDLIPLRYRDQYFHGPLQRLLRARLELIRSADAVLAISASTAADVVELLDVDPTRVHVIDGGCSDRFRPPEEPLERSLAVLRRAVPDLRPGFLFFAANTDPRKNLSGTLRAYALLRPELRAAHQLVMTCSQADQGFLTELREMIEELGLERDVLVTRYVPDDVLIRLFQRCELFVFPSFYEGLGLPLIEALRCGSAAITSDTSSMREIVSDPRARFDPYSARSIADAIERVLGDAALEAELRATAVTDVERYTWANTARASLAAYRAAMDRRWGEVA